MGTKIFIDLQLDHSEDSARHSRLLRPSRSFTRAAVDVTIGFGVAPTTLHQERELAVRIMSVRYHESGEKPQWRGMIGMA